MPVRKGSPLVPNPSPFVPSGLKLAFSDEFEDGVDVEDGNLPATGAKWNDTFLQFNASRNLPANNDECLKGRPQYRGNGGGQSYEELGLHTLVQAGSSLIMTAFEIPEPARTNHYFGFPYAGPHLDGRRSCNFEFGYIEWRFRTVSLGPGTHWSLWLWASTSNDFELDAVEIIGSNIAAPGGPVNLFALNSHDNRQGSGHGAAHPITFIPIDREEMHKFHVFGIEITPTVINWDDRRRAAPDYPERLSSRHLLVPLHHA